MTALKTCLWFNAAAQNDYLHLNNRDGSFSSILVGDIVNEGAESLGAVWGDYGLGFSSRVEASGDLITWSFLSNITNSVRTMQFSDPDMANRSRRFYRAVSN